MTTQPTPPSAPTQPQSNSQAIPGWSNLESGFSQSPVTDFVGTCRSWDLDSGNQFGARVVFSFENCQVKRSDEPVNTTAPVSVSIKISKSENSAWGKFGKSAAEKLNVSLDNFDVNAMMNQRFHLYKLREDYGTNDRGEKMVGDVWRVWEVLGDGEAGTDIPDGVFSNQPEKPARTNVPTPAQPAQPTTTTVDGAPAANVDPVTQAKNTLDGKSDGEFFSVVLTDAVVKTDSNLVNSIVNGAFTQGLLASGEFTRDASGIYHRA